jgi:hypothetical protein
MTTFSGSIQINHRELVSRIPLMQSMLEDLGYPTAKKPGPTAGAFPSVRYLLRLDQPQQRGFSLLAISHESYAKEAED